ncbi:hypothetical protein [Parasitella parasitica]|uniref:Uncharacterized protein n=1 Tax=Parasitella parasitica TaxID=35722 RepID=A0A0B7NWD6_9FUNG|nr:hypothetical protein [Parasitella parasitica]
MTWKQSFLAVICGTLIQLVMAQDNYANKISIDASNGYGFTVQYFDNYKVVENMITNEKYALVCCNQSLANFSSAGYHAVVNTPLSNVGVDTELDSLPFFELLNLSTVVKSASPSANITSPCFAGVSDGPNSTTTTVIDAIFTAHANKAGVDTKPQYISVSAGSETLSPIQQSAWIIFIAQFFEAEQKGLDIYNKIVANYECHKSNLAQSGSKNIAWTTYDVVNKAWTIRYDNYTSRLIQDAGMKLIATNNQTTTYSNLTLFHSALENVEFIIDDSAAANFKTDFAYGDWLSAGGFNPNTNSYAFLTTQNVYRTDKLISTTGFSDWPIRHAARADIAIADVIHMVYNTYEPDYEMTWLRAFAQMGKTTFVSNSTYPSCTNPAERLALDICSFEAFKPNATVDSRPHRSSNPNVQSGLSTGGKVGVAVGVVVGVVAISVVSLFAYKKHKYSAKPQEGSFYRMNDV